MNVLTVANALKFYDLQPERRVRVWFVFLMGIFAAGFLLPFVDPDFSELLEALLRFTQGGAGLPRLSGGQWNFLGFQLIVRAAGVVAGIDYLRHYLGSEGKPRAVSARVWLCMLLFEVLTALIYLVSAPFMLIPYLVFITLFLFVQPELMMYGGSIAKAMQQSWLLGRGVRLHVASSVVLLAALFLIADSWLIPLARGNVYGIALTGGFLFAWEVLSKAKLTGMLYTSLVQRSRTSRPLTPK